MEDKIVRNMRRNHINKVKTLEKKLKETELQFKSSKDPYKKEKLYTAKRELEEDLHMLKLNQYIPKIPKTRKRQQIEFEKLKDGYFREKYLIFLLPHIQSKYNIQERSLWPEEQNLMWFCYTQKISFKEFISRLEELYKKAPEKYKKGNFKYRS